VNDTISLRLPATASYGRIVRAAGANLATRLGWQAMDIGALRVAIDEALNALVGDSGGSGELSVDFTVAGSDIDLVLALDTPPKKPLPTTRVSEFEAATKGRYPTAAIDAAAHRIQIITRPTS